MEGRRTTAVLSFCRENNSTCSPKHESSREILLIYQFGENRKIAKLILTGHSKSKKKSKAIPVTGCGGL
jgi:hypothetical protein